MFIMLSPIFPFRPKISSSSPSSWSPLPSPPLLHSSSSLLQPLHALSFVLVCGD